MRAAKLLRRPREGIAVAVAVPAPFGIMLQDTPNRRVTPIADGTQRLRRERILHSAAPGVHHGQLTKAPPRQHLQS
eukprot:COSAG03_NODE_498_length_7409_cov_13.310534_10_plen_76_part_00